jgi:hypothetical protein
MLGTVFNTVGGFHTITRADITNPAIETWAVINGFGYTFRRHCVGGFVLVI